MLAHDQTEPVPHDGNRIGWIIIGIGLILRLLWALVIPVEPVSDAAAYEIYARNLVEYGVYGLAPEDPGAYWPVGTAAIAAVTFLVLGDSFAGIVALNLLASAILMLIVLRLGTRWVGVGPALLSTGLVAIWPNLIFFTTILSSELYFLALVMTGLWFWDQRHSMLDFLLCGLCWGLACYLRPVALLLPVAMVAAAFPFGLRQTFATAVRAAATLAVILAVLSPWTYRNYQLFGEPVLVSTNFGPNLWMGNNPDSTGGYMELPVWIEGMSEVERAQALSASAKEYILSNPAAFAVRTLFKAVRLLDRETIGVAWNRSAIERLAGNAGVQAAKLVATGYWYGVLALAGLGLWQLASANPWSSLWRTLFHPATLGILYFTALHAVIVVEDRYHMPSSGFFALLAGVGLARLVGVRLPWLQHLARGRV